jgi:hypothetical protein
MKFYVGLQLLTIRQLIRLKMYIYDNFKLTYVSADRITLTFTHMDLERYSSCIHDYVVVFDGDNANGTVIGRYCGNRIPTSMTSQGSSMTVQFVSDPSVQLSGFRALYTTSISSKCF